MVRETHGLLGGQLDLDYRPNNPRGLRNTLPCENHLPSLIFFAAFSHNSFIFLKDAALCFSVFHFSSFFELHSHLSSLCRTEICIYTLLMLYRIHSHRQICFVISDLQTMKTHMFSSRLWPHPLKSDGNCLAWEGCHIHPFCEENDCITTSVFNLSEKQSHSDFQYEN